MIHQLLEGYVKRFLKLGITWLTIVFSCLLFVLVAFLPNSKTLPPIPSFIVYSPSPSVTHVVISCSFVSHFLLFYL